MATHAARAAHRHHRRKREATRWWEKKHHLVFVRVGEIIAGLALIAVVVQLAYPAQRALPLMKVGGIAIGNMDATQLEQTFDWYGQNAGVTLASPSREWQTQWQEIGVGIDRKSSAKVALEYQWWERLIPFSAAAKAAQSNNLPLVTLIDEERLDAFARKLVQEDMVAAIDATIEVKDGTARINEAKNGYKYDVESVKRQIRTAPYTVNGRVELVPEQVMYARSAAELAELVAEINQILEVPLTIKVADKIYTPNRQEVGSWMTFSEHPETRKLQLTFKLEVLHQYIATINADVAMPGGEATVTLLDGQEIARSGGNGGQAVDIVKGAETIIAHLQAHNSEPLNLPLAIVPPKVNYVRQYSSTNQGLQAIVQDWEASTYGTFGVIVREIGGQNRYAEFQPDRPFVTASTYKLFVYLTVIKKIETGEVSYGQATDMGWSVEDCLEEMIVHSTNPCAISLMNLVGWDTVQNTTIQSGFTSTTVNNIDGGNKYSTVRDETNYMLRLNAGTLMGEEGTQRLLGYLKRQIWRAGIPSGIPRGVTVADKVGFYNGWVHDIAIVYSPNATYILGIMSRGGSDPGFANLSRRVYNFFNN